MSKQRKRLGCLPIIILLVVIFSIFSPDSDKVDSNTPQDTSPILLETNEEVASSVPQDSNKKPEALPASSTSDKTTTTDKVQTNKPVEGNLEVHFIDVGQADSILIKVPSGESMLIDAGNNADGNLVKSYITKQGIDTVDILIGTHPHEDHIGGLDTVINNFDIGKIYMPKISHTSQTFEDVLLAIQNKGLKISSPVAGDTFTLGSANFTILAPIGSTYEDLNNYSIVLKMNYGDTSFLFTGDAEDVSENQMINKGFNLGSDLIKIGHHGSDSSTIKGFLDKVNPKYAVVMVGSDNSYGHPTSTIMDRLKAKDIKVYRTDENGTVIATSDGTNITFNTNPGSFASGQSSSVSSSGGSGGSTTPSPTPTPTVVTPAPSTADRTVYWTPNGKSYHYTDKCSTLSRSKTILSGAFSTTPKSDPCDRCVK